MTVHVQITDHGSEDTWMIDDGVMTGGTYGPYADNTAADQVICLANGEHTLNYQDSYGDGWHGGTIAVLNYIAPIEVSGSGSDRHEHTVVLLHYLVRGAPSTQGKRQGNK